MAIPKTGKYLIPLIGIEIGTEKTGMSKMSNTHLKNGALKLRNTKLGYIFNALRNTNVCGRQTKSYQNKADQLKLFKKGLKSMLSEYPQINWIGLIIHIAYQEVEFLDIGNDWRTFTIPSKKFEDTVNKKLWSATSRNKG